MTRFTTLSLKAAKAPGRYTDGQGLMLVVKPSLSRSWVLRMQINGRRRDFGIGPAHEITLSQARERAVEARKLIRQGIDPPSARKASTAILETPKTFAEVAKLAHLHSSAGWKNGKHREQWLQTLETYAFPSLGGQAISEIATRDIIAVLRPIWNEKEETARRVLQRIRRVINWAHANEMRETECPYDSIRMVLGTQRKKAGHHAALPFAEAPLFMTQVAKADTVGRLALSFLILTATRSGEARGARWNEVNLESATWTIPAERMKAGKAHSIPLSKGAIAILDRVSPLRQSKQGDLIFPSYGGKQLSDMTLLKAVHRLGHQVTVHGFRSTFRDWVAEETTYSDAVAEVALAHSNQNKVESAYRRTDFLDRRRLLMQEWDDFLGSSL